MAVRKIYYVQQLPANHDLGTGYYNILRSTNTAQTGDKKIVWVPDTREGDE